MMYSCRYNQEKHALEVGRRNPRYNAVLICMIAGILAITAAELYVLVQLWRGRPPEATSVRLLSFALLACAALLVCAAVLYLLAKQRTFYFKALERQVIMTRGIVRDRRLEKVPYENLDFCEYKFSRYPLTGHVRLVFKDGTKYWIARHLSDIEVLETNNIMSQFGVPARWGQKGQFSI